MKNKKLMKRMKLGVAGYVFIAIPFLLLIIFNLLPMIFGFFLSFTEWNGISSPEFVGLENYKTILFADDVFYTALRNTLQFAVTSLLGGITVAFIISLAVDKIVRFQTFFRVTYFIPVITPLVVVALIWTLIYADRGMLNYLIGLVGIEPVGWLTDRKIAMHSIVVTSIWQGMGFSMIIFLAALQKIPEDLYEAARIDGANYFQQLKSVTLPGLKDTFAFLTVYGLIGAFQVFDQIYVMTGGGPINSTQTMVYWIYSNFRWLNLGYSSALAYIFFVMLLCISIVQLKVFYKKEK